MATSPTQLTLKKWRKAGYRCQVVEHWNPHKKRRKDLYGCIDVLCIGNGETVGVQSTSKNNLMSRIRKIAEMPETVADLRDAHWRIVVEGWHKPGTRWICKEVDVS